MNLPNAMNSGREEWGWNSEGFLGRGPDASHLCPGGGLSHLAHLGEDLSLQGIWEAKWTHAPRFQTPTPEAAVGASFGGQQGDTGAAFPQCSSPRLREGP